MRAALTDDMHGHGSKDQAIQTDGGPEDRYGAGYLPLPGVALTVTRP